MNEMTSTNPKQTSDKTELAEKKQGEVMPPIHSATTNDIPVFGWSAYAERINGRFAMIGFISILLVEALSHGSFLHWSGIIE